MGFIGDDSSTDNVDQVGIVFDAANVVVDPVVDILDQGVEIGDVFGDDVIEPLYLSLLLRIFLK